MKIVVAPDSYKGCLKAHDVASSMASGISAFFGNTDIALIPASDGGEGMLDALGCNMNLEYVSVKCHDALLRPIISKIGISGDTAIIEAAQANGIDLIGEHERDIMRASSYGVGELIIAALNHSCKKIIIGLGGSATNDAGVGMMCAMGMKKDGTKYDISSVDNRLSCTELIVACDVANPLLGPNGATKVYGRQKGASERQLELLEAQIAEYARMVYDIVKHDYTEYHGAGAAGGIAFSLLALCGAQIRSGAQVWMELSNFANKIKNADYVITGEGKSDKQTLMGKLAYHVLQVCKSQSIPCLLVSGAVKGVNEFLNVGFAEVVGVSPRQIPLEISLRPDVARENIKYATRRLFESLAADRIR